jgi:hypothetical protein
MTMVGMVLSLESLAHGSRTSQMACVAYRAQPCFLELS